MQYFCVYKVEKSVNIFETKNAIITRFESITTEDDIIDIQCRIAEDFEACSISDITLSFTVAKILRVLKPQIDRQGFST